MEELPYLLEARKQKLRRLAPQANARKVLELGYGVELDETNHPRLGEHEIFEEKWGGHIALYWIQPKTIIPEDSPLKQFIEDITRAQIIKRKREFARLMEQHFGAPVVNPYDLVLTHSQPNVVVFGKQETGGELRSVIVVNPRLRHIKKGFTTKQNQAYLELLGLSE